MATVTGLRSALQLKKQLHWQQGPSVAGFHSWRLHTAFCSHFNGLLWYEVENKNDETKSFRNKEGLAYKSHVQNP